MDQQTPPTQHPHVPAPKKGGMSVGWIVAIVVGLGVVLVGLPCGALFVGIMLPALGAARQSAREVMSESNLRMIHQAMVVYAQNNGDAYPPAEGWADLLVDGGWLPAPMPVSPVSDGVGPDYFYVPGALTVWTADTSRRILLYEDPAHHTDGVLVLFVDGSIEMVPHAEFERLISGIVQPDGTVYEPEHGP